MSPFPPVQLTAESKTFLSYLPPKEEGTGLTIEQLRNAPSIPLPDSVPRPKVTVEQIEIPCASTDRHAIPVDVYRPASAVKDEILPVLVYFPGGGWGLPPQGAHPFLVTKLAGEAHCAVFMVNYSLSPEVRFPVAVEECYSVTAHVSDPANAASHHIDPTRVAVGGDSAGGNLTISTTILAKQRNLANKIKFQILYYPCTDASMSTPSYQQFGEGHFLTMDVLRLFDKNYYNGPEDKENILGVPIKAAKEDLTGLPPALSITGEADVLRDEGEAFARKLVDAGVTVTSYRILGVLHGFMSVPPLVSLETFQVIDLTTAQLRRVFSE